MRTLLAALLLATVAAAQSFEALLPDSTIFYVSLENLARTKERYEKSPLAALWNDDAMKAFAEKPLAKWAELMDEMRKDEGIAPGDVLDLLAGQLAFAFVWGEGYDQPKGVLLADIGENGERFREFVAKAEKRFVEEGGRKKDEQEFRGLKITTYREGEETGGTSWMLDGKTFALAENADLLKDVLARKDRTEGTLATRELYRRTRERAGGRAPDLLLYADGVNFVKALRESEELDDEDMKIGTTLGLLAIEALEFDITLEPEGLVMRGFLGVKGEKTGILKIADGKNSALLPPRYTPADALSAGAWALDLPALWEEVRKVADAIEEGSMGTADEWMKAFKEETGVDIAADLIATLGAELTYHTRPPAEGAMGPAAMLGRIALAFQVKDRERFEGALDKVIAAFAPDMAAQDYLGVKLRLIQTPVGVQPAMAVLPDRLVFAVEADDVKDVITRYGKEAKGFLDREDVAKAIAKLPPQRFAISVEDAPKSLSTSMSTLGTTMRMFGGREGAEVAEFVDFSLFPPAEVLAKYMGISAAAVVNEEDGVSFVSMFNLVSGG